MLFGDVIAIALSIVGFLLSMQGLWLISRALWPQRVEAATRHSGQRTLVCFLVGLPVTLVAAVLAAVISRAGTFGQVSAFGVAMLYVVYANVGVAGFVTHIGRRLSSPADTERPWKATVRGGIAMELAWLIPILGWIGLLGITLILGAGAMTLALFSSSRRSESATSVPIPAPSPMPAAVSVPPLPRVQRPRAISGLGSDPQVLEPSTPVGVE